MTTLKKQTACAEKTYVVHQKDLPLCCPTNDMELWNAHPKVYLPIDKTGEEVCPYCGSRFILSQNYVGEGASANT